MPMTGNVIEVVPALVTTVLGASIAGRLAAVAHAVLA